MPSDRARVPAAAEDLLCSVEHGLRNHRLVRPAHEFTFVQHDAVIERVGKEVVEGAYVDPPPRRESDGYRASASRACRGSPTVL